MPFNKNDIKLFFLCRRPANVPKEAISLVTFQTPVFRFSLASYGNALWALVALGLAVWLFPLITCESIC